MEDDIAVLNWCHLCWSDGKILNILVWCGLVLIVVGKENSGFIESDDEVVPKNKRVKNKHQDVIER